MDNGVWSGWKWRHAGVGGERAGDNDERRTCRPPDSDQPTTTMYRRYGRYLTQADSNLAFPPFPFFNF